MARMWFPSRWVDSASRRPRPARKLMGLRISVELLEPRELLSPLAALFTNGGPFGVGGSGTVSFMNPSGGSGDYTYSYDFDDDGQFEISNSALASATIPSVYLGNEGTQLVHGRISDSDGSVSDYLTRVTVLSQPPGAGLVAAYNFDGGVGNVLTDFSGLNNDGLIANAVWSSVGRFGGSLAFNGVNSLVTVPDAAPLHLSEAVTLEAWVQPTVLNSWRTIVYKQIPTGQSYSLWATNGGDGQPAAFITFNGQEYNATSPTTIPLSAWTHLAETYDGGVISIYVNDVLQATRAVPGSLDASSLPLYLGGNALWGQYFKGNIDDVRVYNRALTPAEIQFDMNTPVGNAQTTDITPPAVAVVAPTAAAAVSGTVTVSASATDDVSVVGVQFLLDGNDVGGPDIVPPYNYSWDTSKLPNGTYTLAARAWDAVGNMTTSAPVTVTVANVLPPPPSASAGPSPSAGEGAPAAFQGSATGSGLIYGWSFGDGSTASGTLTPSHVYADQGTYLATLTVTDSLGRTATSSVAAVISNVAPTATFGPTAPPTAGTPVMFWFTKTFDPSPIDSAAGFTYSYDFDNDGVFEVSNSASALASYTFPSAGTYTVRGRIADKDGGASDYITTVTVRQANSSFSRPALVLDNFDAPALPVNGDGDTYGDQYNGAGTGSVSLDTADAVSGGSMRFQMADGRFYAEFNPYNYALNSAYPAYRGFARDYAQDKADWQFNTYNRLSFWIKLPTSASEPFRTDGGQRFEFGTYVKQVTNADQTSDEAGGEHYYHLLNIPAVGAWTHVVLNMHPDHVRGTSGGVDPGFLPYPTTSAFNGDDPANTFNYFDTLTRFYIQENYSLGSDSPAEYLLDDFQVYQEPYQENDPQVYSLTATYAAPTNDLVVTWNRNMAEDQVRDEVRYSFTDIHAIGWDAATPAPNGVITPPGVGGYNNMTYDTSALPLAGHSVVYIAIKPENSDLFTQIAVPLGSMPLPYDTGPVYLPSAAPFQAEDTTTQGSWQGVYGGQGGEVIGDRAAYPAYVQVSTAGASPYLWAGATIDPHALQKAGTLTDRVAGCWYGSTFSVDVNFTDGNAHRLALYLLDWDGGGRSERVDVVDVETGSLLDSRTVADFAGGKYLVWNLFGHVQFQFTALTGPNAVLSGLLFGPPGTAPLPTAQAACRAADSTTQGAWQGAYGGEGANIIGNSANYPAYAQVDTFSAASYIWAGSSTDPRALLKPGSPSDRVAGCFFGSSFTVDVNLSDGNAHQLAVYLLDWDDGARAERVDVLDAVSGQVLNSQLADHFVNGTYLSWIVTGHVRLRFTALNGPNAVLNGLFFGGGTPPPSSIPGAVKFLMADTATQGGWQGNYGRDGSNVIGDSADYPGYVQINTSGASSYIWSGSSTDPRALQKSGSPSHRIAGCWYGSSFTVDINLAGTNPHRLAVYLLDWDGGGRTERIDVLDAGTGQVLDSQIVSDFTDGTYLSWNVAGHVQLRFTVLDGVNAVVSGLFFDAAEVISAPEPLTSGTVSFAGSDAGTQGNWQGNYGSQGGNVLGDNPAYPSYVHVSDSGAASYVWAASTSDPRALQKTGDPTDRVAACSFGSSFTIDVNLADGNTHRVAVYLLDWDDSGRSELIDVLDAATGQVLDSRSAADFADGMYLSWNLSGNVRLRFTAVSGPNAVLSGLFFD